jgi:hypothetical protein
LHEGSKERRKLNKFLRCSFALGNGYQNTRLSGSACLPVGRDIRISEYQAVKEALVWSPDILVP